MLISGGARAVNVVLVVARAKIVAQMLGPEGIGLMGLFAALQEIGAQIADGGQSHSAVRQIAVERAAPGRIAPLRRALALAAAVAGIAGLAGFWLIREEISVLAVGDASQAGAIGLLGVGVFLMVLFRWQQALLSGYRRVADLARMVMIATTLATSGGVAVIWWLGKDGLVWAVILMPAMGIAVAPFFTRRLPQTGGVPIRWSGLATQWRALLPLGLALMASALITLISPLIIRIWLIADSGLAAAGLYQAAWVVAMHVMTVLMTAVAADYLPRLSATIADPVASTALVNLQSRVHLAFGGPVVLGVITISPWVLELLYASAFSAAAPLLQWHMLALLLRLASVPVDSILTARAEPLLILPAQLVHLGVTLGLVWVGLPALGLEIVGIAVAAGQAVHLVLVTMLAARIHGFRWQRVPLVQLGVTATAGLTLIALGHDHGSAALGLGLAITLVLGIAAAAMLTGRSPLRRLRGVAVSGAGARRRPGLSR